jgi:hypothetical protein
MSGMAEVLRQAMRDHRVTWEMVGNPRDIHEAVAHCKSCGYLGAEFETWEHQSNIADEMLSAAGFGPVAEARAGAHNLKLVRGELKSFGKNLDSWESQGHSTVTIRHMRQLLVRLAAAVRGEG